MMLDHNREWIPDLRIFWVSSLPVHTLVKIDIKQECKTIGRMIDYLPMDVGSYRIKTMNLAKFDICVPKAMLRQDCLFQPFLTRYKPIIEWKTFKFSMQWTDSKIFKCTENNLQCQSKTIHSMQYGFLKVIVFYIFTSWNCNSNVVTM